MEADSAASRASLAAIEEARKRRSAIDPLTIVRTIVAPGSVTLALKALRMAKKLDPYSETARIALEPWIVEATLARLSKPLRPADQRIIVTATRTPRKVRWPNGGANIRDPSEPCLRPAAGNQLDAANSMIRFR